MDPTEALPDDALANILRRLLLCELAASRCVRKAWCAVVGAHRLMLPHILPSSVCGLFVNYIDYKRPRFFARPTTKRPAINGNLGFLPGYNTDFEPIVDHCNGLLIYGCYYKMESTCLGKSEMGFTSQQFTMNINFGFGFSTNQPKGIDHKTWFLYGDNDEDGANKMPESDNFEWNSDDDNVLNIEDDYEYFYSYVSILGFHPYKEIVFLEVSSFKGVAYHLNTSKVQYLGKLRPKDYTLLHTNGIYESFPYTPCMVGELSESA
ncbi:hypothetical protein ACQ4PT_022909 [Festuca glaucescens]